MLKILLLIVSISYLVYLNNKYKPIIYREYNEKTKQWRNPGYAMGYKLLITSYITIFILSIILLYSLRKTHLISQSIQYVK